MEKDPDCICPKPTPKEGEPSLHCLTHGLRVCRICIPFEHPVCVVSTSPADRGCDSLPKCCYCKESIPLQGDVMRLNCLDLIHSTCFVSLVDAYPEKTSPDAYLCPRCSTKIWPLISTKDSGIVEAAIQKMLISLDDASGKEPAVENVGELFQQNYESRVRLAAAKKTTKLKREEYNEVSQQLNSENLRVAETKEMADAYKSLKESCTPPEGFECVACMDRPRAVMYKPCLHLVVCQKCAIKQKVDAWTAGQRVRCPTCRREVEEDTLGPWEP